MLFYTIFLFSLVGFTFSIRSPISVKTRNVVLSKTGVSSSRTELGTDIDELHNSVRNSVSFDCIFGCLEQYKCLYGDLLVPQNFKVPSSPPWSIKSWSLPLGLRVNRLRKDCIANNLHSFQKSQLNQLGFIWNVNDHLFEEFCSYLHAYKTNYGHTKVPTNFVTTVYRREGSIEHLKENFIPKKGYKLGLKWFKIRKGTLFAKKKYIAYLRNQSFLNEDEYRNLLQTVAFLSLNETRIDEIKSDHPSRDVDVNSSVCSLDTIQNAPLRRMPLWLQGKKLMCIIASLECYYREFGHWDVPPDFVAPANWTSARTRHKNRRCEGPFSFLLLLRVHT